MYRHKKVYLTKTLKFKVDPLTYDNQAVNDTFKSDE